MDILFLFISLILSISSLLAFTILLRPHRRNLPPTPFFSLPLIGHLHLVKHPVHRTLHDLSKKYGDVFSLRFGSHKVVIVSSPSIVQECFTKNDIVLANRPLLLSGKHLSYNHTTMVATQYGEHWRNLRRIGALEIFSTSRLNLFAGIREDEVKRLMRRFCGGSLEEFVTIEPGSMFLDLMYNVLMRMVAGEKAYEGNKGKSREFREVVTKIMANAGATNPGDLIPLWNWIDLGGFEKKVMKLGQTMDELLQDLVDGIRNNQESEGDTMIARLLHLQKTDPLNYSDQIIKGLIQIIFIAGIDTTAITLEWALSHLLNNPDVLDKAIVEIDSFVGQERLVNESDLSSLSYLQGIVTETLRLNPSAPLLVAHCASKDCRIGGYDVPRDTIVLVNAWLIHRDPDLWEDATSFKPERHINSNEGDSYKLLPFGLGRRACPGMGIAQRVATLALASMVQCFEWQREGTSLVDMSEGEGITMPKARPLVAKCKPRPIIKAIFNDAIDNNILKK